MMMDLEGRTCIDDQRKRSVRCRQEDDLRSSRRFWLKEFVEIRLGKRSQEGLSVVSVEGISCVLIWLIE